MKALDRLIRDWDAQPPIPVEPKAAFDDIRDRFFRLGAGLASLEARVVELEHARADQGKAISDLAGRAVSLDAEQLRNELDSLAYRHEQRIGALERKPSPIESILDRLAVLETRAPRRPSGTQDLFSRQWHIDKIAMHLEMLRALP